MLSKYFVPWNQTIKDLYTEIHTHMINQFSFKRENKIVLIILRDCLYLNTDIPVKNSHNIIMGFKSIEKSK